MGESAGKTFKLTANTNGIWIAVVIGSAASLLIFSIALAAYRTLGQFETSPVLIFGVVLIALWAAMRLPPSLPLILVLVFLESPLLSAMNNQQSAYISSALMAWAALGALVSIFRPKNSSSNPLLRKVWLFAVYGVFSAMWGYWGGNPATYVFGDLFQVEEFAVLFILITQLVVDEKIFRRLLTWTLASTLITILWQLVLSAKGVNPNQGLPYWQGAAFGDALPRTIDLDAIYLFTILLSLYPFLKSSRQRLLIWFLLIPTMANLVMSLTRGVWLASGAAVLVCAWLLARQERAKLLKALTVVVVCLALSATAWRIAKGSINGGFVDAIKERLSYGVVQVEEGWQGGVGVSTRRFVEVTTIVPQILPSLFFGRGLGASYLIDAIAVLNSDAHGLIDYHYIHNLYLLVTFRMGLIGLAIFGWILYSYFRKSMAGYFELPRGPSKGLTAGLIASMAGQVVLSMTSPTLLNHPTCGLAACVMALTFRIEDFQIGPKNRRAVGKSLQKIKLGQVSAGS